MARPNITILERAKVEGAKRSPSTTVRMNGKAVWTRPPDRAATSCLVDYRRITRLTPDKSMGRRNIKLEVYLQESRKLKSFAIVESNGTLPWLGSANPGTNLRTPGKPQLRLRRVACIRNLARLVC